MRNKRKITPDACQILSEEVASPLSKIAIEEIYPFYSFLHSTHIHVSPSAGIDMGTDEWHTNFNLPARPPDNSRVEEEMPRGIWDGLIQAYRAWLKNQDREVNNCPKTFYNSFVHDNQLERHVTQSSTN
ncbi:hypothetical protein AYI68_g2956 [Smittium mucronatum]|uniref:Uncharacterized protein n=1 Tax=Smittium mucronatum TaxID=133383 RepID=A0A1R0H190_9FUNG|nr:hypothetical protein AYI68_g2956 [Smittium mucronatum]